MLYVALFLGWTIYSHSWPGPDEVAIFLLLFAFLAARGRAPCATGRRFILLLLGYMALTGIGNGLAQHAHIQFPIDIDRRLFFGALPTISDRRDSGIQIASTGTTTALASSMRHALCASACRGLRSVDVEAARILAFRRLPISWPVYSGFVTYILYPMAPPWWAAEQGRIPEVNDILGNVQYGGSG